MITNIILGSCAFSVTVILTYKLYSLLEMSESDDIFMKGVSVFLSFVLGAAITGVIIGILILLAYLYISVGILGIIIPVLIIGIPLAAILYRIYS